MWNDVFWIKFLCQNKRTKQKKIDKVFPYFSLQEETNKSKTENLKENPFFIRFKKKIISKVIKTNTKIYYKKRL